MGKPKAKLLPDADGKVRPYQCQECGKRFTACGSLKSHRSVHTGEKPYKCEECGLQFTQVGQMRLHTRLHTGEKPHKCKDCGKKFTQKSALTTHSFSHTENRPFTCNECDKTYKKEVELSRHLLTHANEWYGCNECPKIFKSRVALKRHLRVVHIGTRRARKHKCEVCGFCVTTSEKLKLHMYVHTGQRPLKFKCDQCDVAFAYPGSLLLHEIQVHQKEYPHKCNTCGKGFISKSFKMKHLRQDGICKYIEAEPDVVSDIGSARCEVCDAILPKSFFKEHQKVVHGIGEKYRCEECERVFFRLNDLKLHLRDAHIQPDMDNTREDCGLRAKTSYKLKHHMYDHTGQRALNLKCDYCKAAFPSPSSLQLHKIQEHRKEYLYKCNDCGRGFHSQYYKEKHLLQNGKCKFTKAVDVCYIRPVRCELCDIILPKRSFKEHQQIVHGIGKKYACGKCERVCFSSYDLKRHVRIIHSQPDTNNTRADNTHQNRIDGGKLVKSEMQQNNTKDQSLMQISTVSATDNATSNSLLNIVDGGELLKSEMQQNNTKDQSLMQISTVSATDNATSNSLLNIVDGGELLKSETQQNNTEVDAVWRQVQSLTQSNTVSAVDNSPSDSPFITIDGGGFLKSEMQQNTTEVDEVLQQGQSPLQIHDAAAMNVIASDSPYNTVHLQNVNLGNSKGYHVSLPTKIESNAVLKTVTDPVDQHQFTENNEALHAQINLSSAGLNTRIKTEPCEANDVENEYLSNGGLGHTNQ